MRPVERACARACEAVHRNDLAADEASHVAYLQLFISELRPLHFKTPDGPVEGRSFIDPVWAKIVAYGAEEVPRIQRQATRELIAGCLKAKAGLLERFDALGDQ